MSVFLTFLILDKWNAYDAIEDFVDDTIFVKKLLENQRQTDNIQASTFYKNLDNQRYPFDINWLGTKDILLSCNNCIHLGRHKHVDVFELDSGELLSVHSIINTADKFIIKDKIQAPELLGSDIEPWPFDVEEYSISILLFVIVIVIGLVLYLPIRKLQKNIDHLKGISDQFGKGALQTRANALPEPLTTLAQTFNQMALDLSNKVNESQVFAQAVPHELRTPLSRIQLAAGILRQKNTDPEQTELIDNIDQYIVDIDELCSQIFQYSKLNIQTEEHSHEAIDLNSFIEHRIAQLQLNPTISITLNITEQITFNCNAANLRLIIDNLVKNAVHYAKNKVTVSINTIENSLIIAVEDDGKGIPVADYDTVFIPYARLDNSRTRKTGGLGLGLAITKGTVNQLGGEIHVSKSTSGGAIFKVNLPL